MLDLLGATLTDDDYDKLVEAVHEILARMTRNPKRRKQSASS